MVVLINFGLLRWVLCYFLIFLCDYISGKMKLLPEFLKVITIQTS
jgi:hypothetical protein